MLVLVMLSVVMLNIIILSDIILKVLSPVNQARLILENKAGVLLLNIRLT